MPGRPGAEGAVTHPDSRPWAGRDLGETAELPQDCVLPGHRPGRQRLGWGWGRAQRAPLPPPPLPCSEERPGLDGCPLCSCWVLLPAPRVPTTGHQRALLQSSHPRHSDPCVPTPPAPTESSSQATHFQNLNFKDKGQRPSRGGGPAPSHQAAAGDMVREPAASPTACFANDLIQARPGERFADSLKQKQQRPEVSGASGPVKCFSQAAPWGPRPGRAGGHDLADIPGWLWTQRRRQPGGQEGEAQASPRGRDGGYTHLGIGVQTGTKALALTTVPRGPVLTSGKAGGGVGKARHTGKGCLTRARHTHGPRRPGWDGSRPK